MVPSLFTPGVRSSSSLPEPHSLTTSSAGPAVSVVLGKVWSKAKARNLELGSAPACPMDSRAQQFLLPTTALLHLAMILSLSLH